MTKQVAAIHQTGEQYRAAMEAGDIDAVMAFWADDSVWMPPGRPSIVGKKAIRDAYQELFFKPFNVQRYAVVVEEIIPAGEWTFERATMRITLTPKGGGDNVEGKGKYVIVWRVGEDGTWKLARAINNSDLPEGHASPK